MTWNNLCIISVSNKLLLFSRQDPSHLIIRSPGRDRVYTDTESAVIAVPAEVKHWHGAAKDSWMQHLTYHKDVQADASNEWLEPVDDATYNKIK